jgi:DNA-binding beta-propeller fold protein YncE
LVFVTGYSWETQFNQPEYATVAYDARTGAQRWVSRFNGGLGQDAAYALGVSPDGSMLYVSGSSRFTQATLAYDTATGTELWRAQSREGAQAQALMVSPDGSVVFVVGYGFSHVDFATVAYDAATGQILWSSRYNGPGDGYDFPYGLAVTPDGSKVFVTGASTGVTSDYDYATIAYDAATGTGLWLARYNGPGNGTDGAYAIVVSPDGLTVIVTGGAEGISSSSDYTTLAYDAASGAPRWIARFNGPANAGDNPSDLGLSPDGSVVFVTGTEGRGGLNLDYLTIAYQS